MRSFRAKDRMVAAIGSVHDAMRYHWQAARRRNEGDAARHPDRLYA